ncbi:hypothetical protein [Tautonia sociabilis]|uniref:Uncharacterized protein n=1 Tax=Tautonia sociabilis TaxID=2080755 RepID=A0A432MQ05_9BACT|nr:hypothetical protein [Tautonia sociabilis]RUL89573.1 hypothetical protein TsocGM_02035 [Tautonia sociabilis]
MSEHDHADHSLNPHARGHQEDRIDVGAIGVFAVGLVVSVTIVFLVVAFMMARFRDANRRKAEDRPPMMALEDPALFPGARLQESPGRDMRKMRQEIEARLGSYGWVDREAGIAHIPIDRAIALTAEQGLPTRPHAPEGSAE